ncbi:hypothetical protein GWI33_007985 [Rhynchophorus ferrugineus]|uniref:Mos1 transposase HTH domain-containing protein n=1 Tax=Rhynchophorus ferrugineus TaxID=354439 RepID=A0A834IGQ1_RHYFE|nr:hypothetical protein GWI33_007985 [Rhynchophorus ferrugineus]
MNQKQFRVLILHCFLIGKYTAQAKQWFQKCYTDADPAEIIIKRCFADFKRGRRDTDEERSGRPNEVVSPENIKMHIIIFNDRKVKLPELDNIVKMLKNLLV